MACRHCPHVAGLPRICRLPVRTSLGSHRQAFRSESSAKQGVVVEHTAAATAKYRAFLIYIQEYFVSTKKPARPETVNIFLCVTSQVSFAAHKTCLAPVRPARTKRSVHRLDFGSKSQNYLGVAPAPDLEGQEARGASRTLAQPACTARNSRSVGARAAANWRFCCASRSEIT